MKKPTYKRLPTTGWLIALMALGAAASELPKGLMLNLDFRKIEEGLIPNKTLYPLYVPTGNLASKSDNRRTVLIFEEGQSLTIPHSSLLDPDGGEWIATVRVFARTDGIVMSQGNEKTGYTIYIRDGEIRVSIRSDDSVAILKERPEYGITPCLNRWVSIEVRIGPGTASLILNRAQVAFLSLPNPPSGSGHHIRLGEHLSLPIALQHDPEATPTGFTGAVRSVKILRH